MIIWIVNTLFVIVVLNSFVSECHQGQDYQLFVNPMSSPKYYVSYVVPESVAWLMDEGKKVDHFFMSAEKTPRFIDVKDLPSGGRDPWWTIDGREPLWSEREIGSGVSNDPRYNSTARILWTTEKLFIHSFFPDSTLVCTQCDSLTDESSFVVLLDPTGYTNNIIKIVVNIAGKSSSVLERKLVNGTIEHINIPGVKTEVMYFGGKLNTKSDHENIHHTTIHKHCRKAWRVNIIIPWNDLKELLDLSKVNLPPRNGDQWRLNFGRYRYDYIHGNHTIERKRSTPEMTAFSPTGISSFSVPFLFGYLQFNESCSFHHFRMKERPDFHWKKKDQEIQTLLYWIRSLQFQYFEEFKNFSSDYSSLKISQASLYNSPTRPHRSIFIYKVKTTENGENFDASLLVFEKSRRHFKYLYHVDKNGRIWKTIFQIGFIKRWRILMYFFVSICGCFSMCGMLGIGIFSYVTAKQNEREMREND